MGEELKIDDGIPEWEAGLPSLEDLTPLSQSLIPSDLASAFRISPELPRTAIDVNLASRNTLSTIRSGSYAAPPPFDSHAIDQFAEEVENEDELEPSKCRRTDGDEDPTIDNGGEELSSSAAKTLKRPRLVWTPELHKRFVEVVARLGLKNAVPKTIMQMMNVVGLTRENVASHLQKYRLYVKRMQGLSNEGPSPSDHLFASMPVPPRGFNDSSPNAAPNHGNEFSNGSYSSVADGSTPNSSTGLPIPMPYPPPPPHILPMQMVGMQDQGHGLHGYEAAYSHHNQQHYQQHYATIAQHQRNWSATNNGYPHDLAHNNSNNNKC